MISKKGEEAAGSRLSLPISDSEQAIKANQGQLLYPLRTNPVKGLLRKNTSLPALPPKQKKGANRPVGPF